MVIEKSYHPAVPIFDPSPEGVKRAMSNYRGCIRTKTLPEGTHEVTDHRWTMPTHHWIVQVMADRTAEVRIIPKEKSGLVADIRMGVDRTTVRHRVNAEDRSTLLGGENVSVYASQNFALVSPVIFKEIVYNRSTES